MTKNKKRYFLKKAGAGQNTGSRKAGFSRSKKQLMLLCAGLAVLAVSVYSFFRQPGKPEIYRPHQVVQKLPPFTVKTSYNDAREGSHYTEVVKSGDTFAEVLERMGIGADDIRNMQAESKTNGGKLHLQTGQLFDVQTDAAGSPVRVEFFTDEDNGERNLSVLRKNREGKWEADVGDVHTETVPAFRAVVVHTSARGALAQAGVPVAVRESLNEILGHKASLDDLKEGDTIRLMYNTLYYRGRELATDDILGAEITKSGKVYQAYLYGGEDGDGRYYDAQGRPSGKGFSLLPVGNVRISSPYGTRYHPILHTIRMHTGIDYAAPTGTPIRAPADGIVESIGVRGGYGNAVVLRHSPSMQTLYGHMSRFAGFSAGSRVKAGDVIGYVGSTGRSTGPHLHYEVRLNGEPVNPGTAALPNKPLRADDLAAFKKRQQELDKALSVYRAIPVKISQTD